MWISCRSGRCVQNGSPRTHQTRRTRRTHRTHRTHGTRRTHRTHRTAPPQRPILDAFAGVVDSYQAQQDLIELLTCVRDKWYLQLSLKVVEARSKIFVDSQAHLELPCLVKQWMRTERVLIRLDQHILVTSWTITCGTWPENTARSWSESCGDASALEAVVAYCVQSIARKSCLGTAQSTLCQILDEEFDCYCAHVVVEMQEDIYAHVEMHIAEIRDFFGDSSTRTPAVWYNMPASTVKCLQQRRAGNASRVDLRLGI